MKFDAKSSRMWKSRKDWKTSFNNDDLNDKNAFENKSTKNFSKKNPKNEKISDQIFNKNQTNPTSKLLTKICFV
jgi:hypothetical protein